MADTNVSITITLSRDEAKAAIDGLKHADATGGLPARDFRTAALNKIEGAVDKLDHPNQPDPAVKADATSRDDTRAPLHVAKDKPRG